MARPKKTDEIIEEKDTKIALLSIDYPSEGLNNMARKINEIIENMERK